MPKKKKKESKEKEEKKVDPQILADKAFQIALDQINKMGDGPQAIKIGRLGEMKAMNLPAIPSGSLALDLALGTSGYPEGRIIEIYGPESSGKTTLLLHAIAEAQKLGYRTAFMDIEHTLDPTYAQKLGVAISGPNGLLCSQPDDADEAMDIIDLLIRTNQVKLIAIDSVASLVTRAEMEKEASGTNIGLQARLMSQVLKRFTNLCGDSGTTLLFSNQIRMKIGVMFGNPETTSGGNALKFYATQRLDIRRTGAIKEGTNIVGATTRVKVVKNKVAVPFKEAHFNIMYGVGIGKEADVITVAEGLGILERSGAWYSYNGEQLGQGLSNTVMILKERPELIAEIRERVLKEV